LNVGNGAQRLLLTADESGYDKRVEIAYTGTLNSASFNFAVTNRDDQGATLTDLTELDAAYTIDGFALTASSNNVSDAVDGLTLNFKTVGSAVLNLARDDAAIAESAQKFVDAYNQLRADLKALDNEGFSTGGLTRSVSSALRDVINGSTTLTGNYTALSQVGIKTDPITGDLEFNSTEFDAALADDFFDVAQLFANDDQGIAFRFDALIDRFLDSSDGLIETRIDTLESRTRSLEDREDSLELRLELKERSLRAEYAELDRLVGSLQSTGNFLTQNLVSF
jgi:flagellar hook-associated protein 2